MELLRIYRTVPKGCGQRVGSVGTSWGSPPHRGRLLCAYNIVDLLEMVHSVSSSLRPQSELRPEAARDRISHA